MRVMFSNILLDPKKIGTRVLDFQGLGVVTYKLLLELEKTHQELITGKLGLKNYNCAGLCEVEVGEADGHFNIVLKPEHPHFATAMATVSCGDGKHTDNPDDYVIRKHWTGKVSLYLKREKAEAAKLIKLIIQTKDAYLRDPDVTKNLPEAAQEKWRVLEEDPSHVLVWVVASAREDDAPMPGPTLLRNLAGFNEDAAKWDANEIRRLAKLSYESDSSWGIVAD